MPQSPRRSIRSNIKSCDQAVYKLLLQVKKKTVFLQLILSIPNTGNLIKILLVLGDIYELIAVVELCLINEVCLAGKIKSKQAS